MTDVLQSAVGWLAGTLASQVSRSIVYIRGGERLTLSATIGETSYEVDSGAGQGLVEFTSRDFIIPAASLILGGSVAEPLPGDRIEHTADGQTQYYEVASPVGGGRVFRYSDPYRLLLRIHTKRIAAT